MKIEKPKEEPKVVFVTNSFSENPINVIVMATGIGMGFMFAGIMLGAPIVLSMILLFAGILGVYGYKTGKTRYELYSSGIYQEIRLFIPEIFNLPPKQRFIEWDHIKSFRIDNDMTRGLEEYEYIKLYLRRAPGQIWITNQKNKEGYAEFRDAFLGMMDEPHRQSDPLKQPAREKKAESIAEAIKPNDSSIKKIVKKKGFYHSWLAKIITLALIAMTLALFYFGATTGMRTANWFRLAAIILPGTLYMVYRVFLTKPEL